MTQAGGSTCSPPDHFLATFAAGVGLRHAELHVTLDTPHPHQAEAVARASDDPTEEATPHRPAEALAGANVEAEELKEPAVAAGVLVAETLSFGDTAERLLEVMLVVLVGVCLASSWDPRALPVALLAGTPTMPAQRWMMGWFGIRGIGSPYYLSYALRHGLERADAEEVAGLTISVAALSILNHGMSARPVLARYERRLSRPRP